MDVEAVDFARLTKTDAPPSVFITCSLRQFGQ
jgi:hypothetical protein